MQNTDTILIALVAVIGLLVLFQVAAMLVVAISVRKGIKSAEHHFGELRDTITPVAQNSKELIATVKGLIDRLEPRIDAAATDLSEMTKSARAQMVKIEASTEDINQRVRKQAARVDSMTTSALNGVDRAGHFINEAVSVPVRQVSGFVAAAKAVLDTLRAPAPARRSAVRPAITPDEKDLFV